jgi:hypothetical protein
MAAMATTRCRPIRAPTFSTAAPDSTPSTTGHPAHPGAGNELRGNDGNDTSDGAQ